MDGFGEPLRRPVGETHFMPVATAVAFIVTGVVTVANAAVAVIGGTRLIAMTTGANLDRRCQTQGVAARVGHETAPPNFCAAPINSSSYSESDVGPLARRRWYSLPTSSRMDVGRRSLSREASSFRDGDGTALFD